MKLPDLDWLRLEFRRHNSDEFLDATMAVCALTAIADGDVMPAELYSIDHLVLKNPPLQEINVAKAHQRLTEYLDRLAKDRAGTEKILSDKIRAVAGDREVASALISAAYLIIVSDRKVRTAEMEEFGWLCGLLDLDPNQVWEELAYRFLLWDDVRGVRFIRVPAGETARIVNQSLEAKWVVYDTFDDAKEAAADLYRRAIEYYKKMKDPELEQDMQRRLAALPNLTANELPSDFD
ncbi:MAG: tellurite resistance TerB family protein [Alphaproteobacteria bacterium]|nr:tellurite resistance TerB family protein [Alphaproteobacteria bacterium]